MKIQSKFKDYYDHISHKFGQDPNVVYVRKNGLEKTFDKKMFSDRHLFEDTFERHAWGGARGRGKRWIDVGSDYDMSFLIAGAYCVPLVRHTASKKTVPLSAEHYPFLMRETRTLGLPGYDKPMLPELPTNTKIEALIKLVGPPVFLVIGRLHENHVWNVADDVPIMADLGIPAIISAEQMWQNIYSTIINVLRNNPDKAPPVQIEEKVRIEYAGFDLKTSFRHPVNSPAAAKKRK